MSRLGVAVIGQAPRPDIAATFARIAGAEVLLGGCLDGLDRNEIAALAPASDDDALYTLLPDGTEATISKAAVVARAPARLAALRAEGVAAVVFNCTGAFPPFPGDAGVIFPSRLLAGLAAALVPQGTIGLFVPLARQCGPLAAKWRRPGVEIVAMALSPTAPAAEVEIAAQRMRAAAPDLICLDCMGYDAETRRIVRATAGVPVLLAIGAVAAIVKELLE